MHSRGKQQQQQQQQQQQRGGRKGGAGAWWGAGMGAALGLGAAAWMEEGDQLEVRDGRVECDAGGLWGSPTTGA